MELEELGEPGWLTDEDASAPLPADPEPAWIDAYEF